MYPTQATVTVFGLPLAYVVEAFTPSYAEMSINELVWAYAGAQETDDAMVMMEIELEMRARSIQRRNFR